ncbi:MAG: hypothetical protein IJX86_06920 [Lachnospiraceae bacterium]|nr:hypothetical protein [Lachnospiraceae bacterium]
MEELLIKITDRLIDYVAELEEIENILSTVLTKINDILLVIGNGEAYRGQNSNELLLFYHSLYQHIEKIYIMYQVGEKYIEKSYEEIVQRDAQLSLSLSILG